MQEKGCEMHASDFHSLLWQAVHSERHPIQIDQNRKVVQIK